ncbi:MAG: RIP metalloprotease RseP [Lachnospiraceae bacterium]|jgi:regulator of sigma E protease|nr:RIP metalloprotease RseP [Lachnospiraceae bacterium]
MNIIIAILILGFIIIIHELGHFLLAKKNGVTVTEFSVGMGPRIASFEKNGTRYSLKLLPFGGSCMMLGEDETIEDEGAFNKKGVWARFSILFAGAFFNFLLAIFLSLIVLGADGVDLPDITAVEKDSPAEKAGLAVGDRITEVDGSTIHFSRELMYHFYFDPVTQEPVEVKYIRDGEKYTATMTPNQIVKHILGCSYTPSNSEPATLVEIGAGYPLEKAGIVVGDTIVGIDGTEVRTGKELSEYLDANPLSEKPVSVTYVHEGEERTVSVQPQLYISAYQLGWSYNYGTQKVSPLNVIKYSFYELKFNVVSTIQNIGFLISGKVGMNEIAGPVGIVNMVGDAVDQSKEYGVRTTLLTLAEFTILISANLGVVNLLPIPALDGGRLVFVLIEAIRKKPIPKEKEAIVHLVGMAALMLLMVFVLFNDIKNIFR